VSESTLVDTITRVGIAIVIHEGHLLVGTRGPKGPLPGMAEFPGGKCDPGESTELCAIRECHEETGLTVEPVALLDERRWSYPHGEIALAFHHCRLLKTVALDASACGFRWVPIADLPQFEFPEANQPVIDLLLRSFA